MGFGALEQLIAKGQPSPITSALSGFQQGAQMMPGIKMAQLAPALRQARTQELLAKAAQEQAAARTAQQGKLTGAQQAFNAFQQSLAADQAAGLRKPSARTQFLGAAARKLTQTSQGASVTVSPTGGTQVQFGGTAQVPSAAPTLLGGQPQAPSAQPTALDQTVATQPHPSVAEQQDEAAKSLLFPPTETPAQVADEKQLGADIKGVSTNAQLASDENLDFARKLKKAVKDASAFINPITGYLDWSSGAGTRLRQLLAKNKVKALSMAKGIRNLQEFKQIVEGAGTTKMFPSTLTKVTNDLLDESYQRRLKADFYGNYTNKGGKSSLEASRLWANALSGQGINNVPEKFLDFKVSGTKRNYKDYVNTVRNLIRKNPDRANAFSNIPISSLIREDIG
jgi:hypothetical protein